jgi:hypothetical protein
MNHSLDKRPVLIHVRWRDKERVARLWTYEGQWHGEMRIPGEEDLFGASYPPAPPGTKLPVMELDDSRMELRIEAPTNRVMGIGMAALMALGNLQIKDGWLVIPCCSIMRSGRDDVELEDARRCDPPQAQILSFPTHERGGRGGR